MNDIIKEKIKDSNYYKLIGNVPEGFVMVHEKVLEGLKDFDNWREFKHNDEYIKQKNIDICRSDDYDRGII
jgi:hypothetical protein